MPRRVKRQPPPSRIKYEERNPTVSCRISRDTYDQLTSARALHQQSFADILRLGLERLELYNKALEEARKLGWDEGYDKGSTKGNKDGRDQAYKKGSEEMRKRAFEEGHQRGFAEGKDRGFQQGFKDGFDNAKVQYRVGYECDDCGLWIWAENPRVHLEIARYMKTNRLGHTVCPTRRS